MDAAQLPQGIFGVVRPVEYSGALEKKPRPQQEQALNCPRCDSTNTKFCYYNNYSLSQPRYFCKTCRRYWTAGGTLRTVPVGGSSRKNKRSSSSSSSSSIHSKNLIDLTPPKFSPQNPNIHHGEDLNISYYGISELVALPFAFKSQNLNPQNPNSSLFQTAGGMSSLVSAPIPNPNSVISAGFPMHDPKPRLSFSQDGLENQLGDFQPTVSENPATSNSNGYWSGMLSGSSW